MVVTVCEAFKKYLQLWKVRYAASREIIANHILFKVV